MTREQLERALRKRLEEHRTEGVMSRPLALLSDEVQALVVNLLPWIVEMIEQAEAETREASEKLP